MIRNFREGLVLTIFALAAASLPCQAMDTKEWSVRCWAPDEKRWKEVGLGKMSLVLEGGVMRVTNTSGIHRHAHFVFRKELPENFTFTIEVKGGYELGFLNRDGKDEMLYVELEDSEKFETFALSRQGTRFAVEKGGKVLPLVHFRFDYGDEVIVTLAIKDGETAEIRSYKMEE